MKGLIVMFITLVISTSSLAETDIRQAVIVVNDDSGVLADSDKAAIYKRLLFSEMSLWRKNRALSKTRIEMISTSYARALWIGEPSDLRGVRANDLNDKLSNVSSYCNNLPGTFKALQNTIRKLEREGFEKIDIIFFSSLIDTPRPCSKSMVIKLPQLPPSIDLSTVLTSSEAVESIMFYWVSPHQLRPWEEALDKSIQWARDRGKSFNIYDIKNSIYELSKKSKGGL